MNIKCLFGIHDWAEAEYMSEKDIVNYLLEPQFRRDARNSIRYNKMHREASMPGDYIDGKQRRYICLRKNCCAIKDEIEEFLDYWRKKGLKQIEEENERSKRRIKAKEKFENCLKEKE